MDVVYGDGRKILVPVGSIAGSCSCEHPANSTTRPIRSPKCQTIFRRLLIIVTSVANTSLKRIKMHIASISRKGSTQFCGVHRILFQ